MNERDVAEYSGCERRWTLNRIGNNVPGNPEHDRYGEDTINGGARARGHERGLEAPPERVNGS